MKESIKLTDFLNDVIKAYNLDDDEFAPDVHNQYSCPTCGKYFDESSKFCDKDGTPIVSSTYESLSEETRHNIIRTLYDFNEYDKVESFPYEYVDSVEKRSDDSNGYYNHIIFRRKSDGKCFNYCSYEGRVEEDSLDECEQKVITKTKWVFY